MKPMIIACLLIVCAPPLSYGITSCNITEYPDRSELVCIGDEKNNPEPAVAAAPIQVKSGETLAQNKVLPLQVSEPASSAVKSQQGVVPAGTAEQQINKPVKTSDKAAENLAKRRELATRNSQNLKSYTSAPPPPVQ